MGKSKLKNNHDGTVELTYTESLDTITELNQELALLSFKRTLSNNEDDLKVINKNIKLVRDAIRNLCGKFDTVKILTNLLECFNAKDISRVDIFVDVTHVDGSKKYFGYFTRINDSIIQLQSCDDENYNIQGKNISINDESYKESLTDFYENSLSDKGITKYSIHFDVTINDVYTTKLKLNTGDLNSKLDNNVINPKWLLDDIVESSDVIVNKIYNEEN